MSHYTESEFRADDLDCLVLMVHGMHRCGYVRVPESHPWHEVKYSGRGWDDDTSPESQVDIHGGLTFSGEIAGHSGWWLGFDCAHLDDTLDYWTVDRVTEETARLAHRIANFGRERVA